MATVDELYESKDSSVDYYGLTRNDVVAFLEKYLQSSNTQLENVLEIGCSSGGTGKLMKEKFGVKYYAGVELMADATEVAKKNIDWAMQGNVEEMIAQNRLGEIPDKGYDAILYLDVLEHLYNPWKVLEHTSKLLKPGGLLVGSIPNVGNLYVLWKIMRDRFEYDEDGLLDRTHIRFFTLHTIKKMIAPQFDLVALDTNRNTWKTMNKQQRLFYLATFGQWKRLFVRQYLFVGKLKG
ncbi:MAG: class I SAM-dependent methyltransferase [Bacteroidota bacterium]